MSADPWPIAEPTDEVRTLRAQLATANSRIAELEFEIDRRDEMQRLIQERHTEVREAQREKLAAAHARIAELESDRSKGTSDGG